TNEDDLQAHAVNISKHEDVIEDIPMEEASSDESTTQDESGHDIRICPAKKEKEAELAKEAESARLGTQPKETLNE
nr:hypothetical protein [Tanacetum cinerariifolium]